MYNKIKIVVTDACIFIDLYNLKLITHFFKLNLETHTTMEVYFELYQNQQQVLNAYQSVKKLTIHILQDNDLLQIHSKSYPKSLSQTDKSVLHIANKLNACVLSSDKVVRNYAKNKDIEYHGTIWIFDQFVNQNILTKQNAVAKLKEFINTNFIFQNNQFLIQEIQKRINLWKN